MGKMNGFSSSKITFTPLQQQVFDTFSRNLQLAKQFYFTGGTALSAIYLHHRDSEDLDFFCEFQFDGLIVDQFIKEVSDVLLTEIRFTQIEKTRIYQLVKDGEVVIKIDFAYYPYGRLNRDLKVKGVEVDSLLDIATNKLITITSRNEIKDFVDLFFLLKEYTLWDLIYAVKKKFHLELDLIMLASDFLKPEKFENLPNMLIPLELSKLQQFYKDLAQKLGKSVTK